MVTVVVAVVTMVIALTMNDQIQIIVMVMITIIQDLDHRQHVIQDHVLDQIQEKNHQDIVEIKEINNNVIIVIITIMKHQQ